MEFSRRRGKTLYKREAIDCNHQHFSYLLNLHDCDGDLLVLLIEGSSAVKLLRLLILCCLVTATSPSLADGDIARGKKVFNKCKACHSIKENKHKIGPSLFKIINRKAGTAKGFKRYRGLKGADWIWDSQSLDAYLTDPKSFVKKRTKKRSSMVLKLKKKSNRANVIAYLKTLK